MINCNRIFKELKKNFIMFKFPFTYYCVNPKFFFKKMACQLPTECLDGILEHLEEDKLTLYSCLLVNRLWCKIAVRFMEEYF
jgi:hypothetical protein